jgi:hypothetical protein
MLALVSSALSYTAPQAVCGDATTCNTCIAGDYCAWCAPSDANYPDGASAGRCFDGRDKGPTHGGAPICHPRTQTSECITGFVCGGPPDYKCVSSGIPGEGTPSFDDCEDSCGPYNTFKCNLDKLQCVLCTGTDPKTECSSIGECQDKCIDTAAYKCNPLNGTCDRCNHKEQGCTAKKSCADNCQAGFECEYPSLANASATPQCKPCTKLPCAYVSKDECTTGSVHKQNCAWKYNCNSTSGKCEQAHYGDDTMKECSEHCQAGGFTCDEEGPGKGSCKKSTSGGFKNITDCSKSCPSNATNSTPVEVRGVWRGFEIQNGFKTGEWVANVTENHTTIWAPHQHVFVSGTTSSWHPTGQSTAKARMIIQSTDGDLKGEVHMIYGDRQLDPELQYVAFAVDTKNIGTPPKDWDPAMTTSGQKLLGMYKCASGSKNCKFHLPTAPSPPPVALAAPVDPCNAYATCADCVGTTVGKQICGWCSGTITYNGTASGAHCSGWDGTAQKSWKCYGDYSTGSCPEFYKCGAGGSCTKVSDPTGAYPDLKTCEDQCGGDFVKCDFNGTYRGLQIDLEYPYGEWDAQFTPAKASTHAKFTFTETGYSYEGDVKCKPDAKDPKKGEFQLALTNGTVIPGIYQASNSDQVETTGLTWAQSNVGAQAPPADFDTAMQGTDAQVWGYTKCLDYKAGVCKF